ncbi:MAG: DNA repair exonuclease [Actinobacteria bacterium]|nr:DNA repair exonuclease [Actinomycetota bacterium]
MRIRFLQTGDWQLGMRRYYFSEGTQERYSQARFDAIRTMGQLADDESCQFVLVCGDVFESNQVDRKTVARALEALKEVRVPVYILPGNHDPLDAGAVYDTDFFLERKPENVHVIRDSQPFEPVEGLELVGAPWMSKRPAVNPVSEVIAGLPAAETERVLVAHGGLDKFTPDKDNPLIISEVELEAAIRERKLQYVALGDRHSVTRVGESGRAWYAGTPEVTDTGEVSSSRVLVVDMENDDVTVREVQVGKWSFIRRQIELNSVEDVQNFGDWLGGLENKDSTVLKLDLAGSISLTLNGAVEKNIALAFDVFAAVDVNDDDLMVVPDDEDFSDLGFSGFAGKTVEQLRASMDVKGPEAENSRDALMLLLRLSGSGE